MKRMKTLVIFIAIIAINGCSGYKDLKITTTNILDFRNCELAEKNYNYIEVELPKGFKKKQTNIEGFCEYRFSYKDKSVIYITTNIYKGSRLNYGNLYKIGIDGYNHRKTYMSDTIKNNGKNSQNLYWLEHILGDIVVGYVDIPENRKEEFDKIILSIKRKE